MHTFHRSLLVAGSVVATLASCRPSSGVPPAEPLPASVAFVRPVSFPEAREFLERHELRPYAVHLRVAGASGAPRVEPDEASLAFLDRARGEALEVALRALCEPGGIEARLAAPAGRDPAAHAGLLRAMLTRLELGRRSLDALRADSPVIHGVKVMGPPAAVERLPRDRLVSAVEPGVRVPIRGVERVVVPDPAHPDEPSGPETIPWIEALDPADLRARLERAAREPPDECRAWSARREELRREELARRGGVAPGAGPADVVVELDAYSGRPNPVRTLTAEEAAQLAGLLARLPVAEAARMPDATLGYRGFWIRNPGGDGGIAERVYVARGGLVQTFEAGGRERILRDAGVEAWLIAVARRRGLGGVIPWTARRAAPRGRSASRKLLTTGYPKPELRTAHLRDI